MLIYLNVGYPMVELLGIEQEVWPCWRMCITGVSLSFQKSIPFSVNFSPCASQLYQDLSFQLLFHYKVCLPAAMLSTIMLIDSPSGTISSNQFFLLYHVLVMVYCHSNGKVAKTSIQLWKTWVLGLYIARIAQLKNKDLLFQTNSLRLQPRV